jgi:uncharacterized protein (DUF1697 family)
VRVVALLRGINLGSSRRISMPALRSIVESDGHADVETYLQSGNVVFTPAGRKRDLAKRLERAIAKETGLDVRVILRTGSELSRVVKANPYGVGDPTRVLVAFLERKIAMQVLELGDLDDYAPDDLTLKGRELYISVPNGQSRSKLMASLAKRREPLLTVRNWRTVTALAKLAAT